MIRVVKIGGNVINNPVELRNFLMDFSKMPGKKILVHGGGKEATELGIKLGLEPKMIDGRRVTDHETLDLVTMVYAGLINKRIVSILQEYGCNSVGLTGSDGNVIPAKRRSSTPIDFGFVGDIDPAFINTGFISMLIDNGYVPVFCAICGDKNGGLLNCNADSIAAAVALALSKIIDTELIYCFEKNGVLSDIDNDNSVIPLITPNMLSNLIEKQLITGGMIPKVTNAVKSIQDGVYSVRICNSKELNTKSGTFIRSE